MSDVSPGQKSVSKKKCADTNMAKNSTAHRSSRKKSPSAKKTADAHAIQSGSAGSASSAKKSVKKSTAKKSSAKKSTTDKKSSACRSSRKKSSGTKKSAAYERPDLSEVIPTKFYYLTGEECKISPATSVLEAKVRVCSLHPQYLPPEIVLIHDGKIVEDSECLPDKVAVILPLLEDCNRTSPDFWILSLESLTRFAEETDVFRCAEELVRTHPKGLLRQVLCGGDDPMEISIVRTLTRAGLDIEIVTNALVENCKLGRDKHARMLLSAGADVDGHWDLRTPLTAACFGGNINLVKVLIQAGAGVNKEDGIGTTPLITSYQGGEVSIIKELIHAGANVNRRYKKWADCSVVLSEQ